VEDFVEDSEGVDIEKKDDKGEEGWAEILDCLVTE
jgi:hypothetical protein